MLEPQYLRAGGGGHSRAQRLPVPIPKLCTLVVASAFDAAVHDAYGKAFGVSCYETYGPPFMSRDLSHDLGAAFKGEFLDRYVPSAPRPTHAGVPLGRRERSARSRRRAQRGSTTACPTRSRSGFPRDGLMRFKIKLNGGNLRGRLRAHRPHRPRRAAGVQAARGVTDWKYLLDFNEGCPNVGYLLEFLRARARGDARRASTASSTSSSRPRATCQKDRANVMHEAAKLRPVVIDESLTDLETLLLAREMGYTGVALKACKGQSHAMLMAAAAQKFGMFLCVQDLTCPGASLIHSAGIAARVPGNAGIEANARQFVPRGERRVGSAVPRAVHHPRRRRCNTGQLTGPGLGAVPPGPPRTGR